KHFGGALVWDVNATLTIPTGIANQEAYATVSVNNVLDRKAALYDNGNSLGVLYEYGRQFWLELGYRF
ncbi:MAG TPA: TonB-dependent receptor, partial [Azonexus sp.]|nr:TonB-dependent receptor [Azonexus sp.]